jgi:heavy metal sensor kinase
MRSIRLSLAVYFLALLALALGAASLLIYRHAEQTLEDKRASTAKLLRAQCERQEAEKSEQFDRALDDQAQTLAMLVAQFSDPRLYGLGLLSAVQGPYGYVTAPLWANECTRSRLYGELWRMAAREIKLKDSDRLRSVDGQVAEFFQIDSDWGSRYLSKSLQGKKLPLDTVAFAPDRVLHSEHDRVRLASGLEVRRVVQKMPAPVSVPWAGPVGDRDRGHSRGVPRPDGPRPEGPPLADAPPRPSIYIQCACPASRLEATLTELRDHRDGELARLDEETAASLAGLRNRLLLMNVLTYAAAALGCLLLVWLGLAPLRRLSDAVSRVTPQDLRLPFAQKRLPVELRPIVGRLNETLEQLRRAFAREKQATADISHELRTPLAALMTTIDLALRKPRSGEEYRDFLEGCRESAEQIHRAVERLLTLARLDAGVVVLNVHPVDAAQLAEQCAAVVRPLAEARGLRLSVHRDGPALLNADPDKLREVVTNLLHNAVQYNRPDGAIDLSVGRQNGHLEVEVRDTGIGISADARAHIFERFYRADPARGGDDGLHAGLGLAIVKELIDLMGGTIDVESQEGRGSTFRVRLPAA